MPTGKGKFFPSTQRSRSLSRGGIGKALDGRSATARFIREYERMLRAGISGEPSPVQRAMISRAARLAAYLEQMDERSLKAGGMTEHDSRQYLAWHNSLRRTLTALGLKSEPAAKPTVSAADFEAARRAALAGSR